VSVARLVWAAQVAAVARWKGAAPASVPAVVDAVAELAVIVGTRFYDGEAPKDDDGNLPALPYVVLDTATGAPRGALANGGGEATFSGSIWSGMPSNRQGLQVLSLMEAALGEKLVLDGYHPARLKLEFVTTVVAGTNLRQVPFRCRIFALEAM
jgi:hypothetical protein